MQDAGVASMSSIWYTMREAMQETLEQVFDQTVDVSTRNASTRMEGWRSAMRAILSGDAALLARALRATSANTTATVSGATLLQVALMHLGGTFRSDRTYTSDSAARRLACVIELLDRGADPNLTHCGIPPLAFAVYIGIAQTVRLLIKRGALWQPFEVCHTDRRYDSGRRLEQFDTMQELIWYAGHGPDGAECAGVLEAYLCAGCRQQVAAKRCGRCMLVRYCSVACQRADRPAHRAACNAAPVPSRAARRPRPPPLESAAFDFSRLSLDG
jgi:hypothetical protein